MRLLLGDSLEELKSLTSNSVDTIVTDPPYGLSFLGMKWDYDVPSVAVFAELLRVAKPGASLLCFAGTRTQHRMAVNIEDAGWQLKDVIMWLYGSGFPKAVDISKQLDKRAGAVREVVGTRSCRAFSDSNNYTVGGNISRNVDVTESATREARQWNGWKSHGLKPAYEPIIVAMKSNDPNYAANALKYGVAGLNIDGCRIGEAGRFPANIILDDKAGAFLDAQSGVANGASRFFYCAKASKAERNIGCEGLPLQRHADRIKEDGVGGDNPRNRSNTLKQNFHPTVKPLSLMRYLVRLTATPTGGLVLDPYMGSGTTGMACVLEGRDFIGIEREPEYMTLAERRIAATGEHSQAVAA